MAFFKFRKGGDAPAPTPPESVEAMRRRARVRLTGAAVLVLAGVIGFPLLFDTQPRPVAVDIPIEIPDRNKVKPLAPPAAAATQAPAAAEAPVAAAPAPAEPVTDPAPPAPAARQDTVPEGRPDPKAVSDAKAKGKAEPRTEVAAVRPPARSEADAAKARALLEGRTVATAPAAPAAKAAAAGAGTAAGTAPAAPGESRFVVQVGAFADAAKAQDTRLKVEKSGLKTYTHVAETKEGKRTRVRVGPFATRSEADKAAEKIKGLDLPATVLTL